MREIIVRVRSWVFGHKESKDYPDPKEIVCDLRPEKRTLGVGWGGMEPAWMVSEDGEQTLRNKTFAVDSESGNKVIGLFPLGALLVAPVAPRDGEWLELQDEPQYLNRLEYLDLFTALGESCGAGDGYSTFAIPPRGCILTGVPLRVWIKINN